MLHALPQFFLREGDSPEDQQRVRDAAAALQMAAVQAQEQRRLETDRQRQQAEEEEQRRAQARAAQRGDEKELRRKQEQELLRQAHAAARQAQQQRTRAAQQESERSIYQKMFGQGRGTHLEPTPPEQGERDAAVQTLSAGLRRMAGLGSKSGVLGGRREQQGAEPQVTADARPQGEEQAMHGAQREAHQRTQAEAVPQRALEQQELQRAAEQAWRHDQAVLQAHMQRAQQLQSLLGAASQGDLPELRHWWGQLAGSLASEEAMRVMAAAMVGACSWAAVHELARLWDEPRHGAWWDMCLTPPGAPHPGEHVVFRMIGRAAELQKSKKAVGDVHKICAELLLRNPDLHQQTGAEGLTPLGLALDSRAPLELVKLLAPPNRPDLWQQPVSNRLLPSHESPLKLARHKRKHYKGDTQWEAHYAAVVDYLEGVEKRHKEECTKREAAEAHRLSTDLRAAKARAEAAAEVGHASAVRDALRGAFRPTYEPVLRRVMPEGQAAFLRSLLLRCTSLEAVWAVEEAGRPWGLHVSDDPQLLGELLEGALQRERWGLAGKLARVPTAVGGMARSPLPMALQRDAPGQLISLLIEACVAERKPQGGVSEAAPGELPPAATAAEQGQTAVLEQLLRWGPTLEWGVVPAVAAAGRASGAQRKGKGAARATTASAAQQRSTLLYHAVAAGREHEALLVLEHTQRHLGSPALVAAYLNLFCGATGGGATVLYSATDKMPHSPLIRRLLLAGADPSAQCKRSTAVHLAVQRGHSQLALRLLEATPGKQRQGLLASADADGRTLLHLVVASQDAALVKELMKQGAVSLVGSTVGASPLLLALQLAEAVERQAAAARKTASRQAPASSADAAEGRAAAAERVCSELLAGWSEEQTKDLLNAKLDGPQAQRVSALLERHADTLLTPFLQASTPGRGVAELSSSAGGVGKGGRHLLQLVFNKTNVGLLRVLLRQSAGLSAKGLLLHGACARLPLDVLQALVLAGASVNTRDTTNGSQLVHQAVRLGNLKLLDFLLAQPGGNVEARDTRGDTLLHWAAMHCPNGLREGVMRYLLRRAPSLLWQRNSAGQSPAEHSVACRKLLAALEAELWEQQPGAMKEAQAAAEAASGIKRAAPEVTGDLTLLGPASEPDSRKRQRLKAMARKLPEVLQALAAQRTAADASAGAGSDGGVAGAAAGPKEGKNLREVVADAVRSMPEAGDQLVEDADAAFTGDNEDGAEEAPLAAAVAAAALPSDVEALGAMLADLPWEMVITRDAWHSWLAMDPPFRRMVLRRLQQIGSGAWGSDGVTERLFEGVPPTMELWRTRLNRGGRIVFEVAADYSEASRSWRDMIRLLVITLKHEAYVAALPHIADSHRKGQQVRNPVKLRPRGGTRSGGDARPGSGRPSSGGGMRQAIASERLPVVYDAEESEAEGEGSSNGTDSRAFADTERLYFPPATAGHNTYTLLKFYRLSSELVHAVLEGVDENTADFSFRVSPEEQAIIEMVPQPPRSIILLGRSGTGKTTVAVFRMWSHWLTAWRRGDAYNQVFVTASATLQEQVARSFAKLRAAVVAPEAAAAYAEATAAEPATLRDVPPEAFPLFLSSRAFLRMLDGTIEQPFFPRRADGTILWDRSEVDFDPDGTTLRVELEVAADLELEEGEEEEEKGSNEEQEDELLGGGQGGRQGGGGAAAGGGEVVRWKRQEVTFPMFQEMWRDTTTKEQRSRLKPGLAWLEIVSYIKGSAEAVRTPEGRLGLETYLEVGRKRAPNFDADSRRMVFEVAEAYRRVKQQRGRYDNADVVAHVYRHLASSGYQGVPIHSLYRDEVQDFTQAELLMDLRIVSNPNALFLCGDTAQTIARGIGFRFTDIQTLFWEERRAQLVLEAAPAGADAAAAGAWGGPPGKEPSPEVHMPLIAQLKVNYRTHSGILEVASAVVDALRRFFPLHLDVLARERAIFKGPQPLLLSTVTAEDLAILLNRSDKATSQVEFGAHQVVLVRSMDSVQRLPPGLQGSNALTLTIPQSKGLEFDDVFLVNFCTDSPAKEEWRVLLQYLEELEDLEALKGPAAVPGGRPLRRAAEAAAGVGELGRGALRPLPFDPAQHKLLCEELKHLYTGGPDGGLKLAGAVTRAKNSCTIYDDNPTARAPLYFYLARRGLARVVSGSLAEAGVDSQYLGITQASCTPAAWAQQGYNLLEMGVYEKAAGCFEEAGDAARAQYCLLRGKLRLARALSESSPDEAKAAWFSAGYELLALALNGQPLAELLPPGGTKGQAAPTPEKERRHWATLAARALLQAGERELVVRLMLGLGLFKQARALLQGMNDPRRLADCCLAAADTLRRQGQPDTAVPWLVHAIKQLFALRRWEHCFTILEEDEGVRTRLQRTHPAMVEAIALNAMEEIAAGSSSSGTAGRSRPGKTACGRLVAAARLIIDRTSRCNRLERYGCFAELAWEVKDPVRSGKLLAEHAGYPAAIDRMLQLSPVRGRLPSPALRLLHCLTAAEGSPAQVAAVWGQLQQVAKGSSLAAEVPGMRADLAARLAHQLAGLHPLTSQPLGRISGSAAPGEASALEAARLLTASFPDDEEASARSASVAGASAEGDGAAALAGRLAIFAQRSYCAAGLALGELRCAAAAAAVGAAASGGAEALRRGLRLAEPVLAHFALIAGKGDRAPGRGCRTPDAARPGVEQLETLLQLTGLVAYGGSAAHGDGVTCPHLAPGLPALAEAFARSAAAHAAAGQLIDGCAAPAAPPGLAALRADSLHQTQWRLEALRRSFSLAAELSRVRDAASSILPWLRDSGSGSGGSAEQRLLGWLQQVFFPAGVVDGLPAALAGQDVLPMDKSSLANLLLARFALRTAPHACAPDPTVAFELWRSLTFLLGYDRLQPKVFRECTSSARKRPNERGLLVSISGLRQVPALLLVEGMDKLQHGFPLDAIDAMLFYIERCHAAAEASAGRGAERSGGDIAPGGDAGTGTAAAASNAARAAQADSPPVPPLGAEETCWLLELLAALACAACVPAGGAIYVPRSGADMLLTLPFVSRKSGTGVLAAYAARLAAVEKEAPGRLYELWRRLACALAVAVRSLAAAAGAGGGGSSPSTPSLQAARALLGRLALACGAFLSALAARYPGGADLPAEVPGALYTGLQAAAEVAPSLGAPLTGLCKAQQVSQLVTCLQSVAAGLDTALMQVTVHGACEFDGFPKYPSGKAAGGKKGGKKGGKGQAQEDGAARLARLAAQPVAFQSRGLASAVGSVRMPPLADLQEYRPRVDPEVRRAAALQAIEQHCGRILERRRRSWAFFVIRMYGRMAMRRRQARREKEECEAAALLELEQQRAAAMVDAANAASRYDCYLAWLDTSTPSVVAQCLICQRMQPGASVGAAGGTGAARGLNPKAPTFIRHPYTPEHKAAAAAFQAWVERFQAGVAPLLRRALDLSQRLHGAGQGLCVVDALRHLAAVQEAVQAVQAALAAHDERRQWAAEGAVQAEEGALQAACAAADAWLAELHAAHPPADEAAGGSAGPGGGLVEHERAAAALQAELQALNAAAAGGNDGGGWTTVGPGGRSAAALEGLEDDGDDDDEEEGAAHMGMYSLLGDLEDFVDFEPAAGKRERRGDGARGGAQGGGHGQRHGGGGSTRRQ
ncbi:TPR and ankyrin repeat-containing 1-like isoform A [Micractinium conductrix]|uniref:TPR and ankyrin repeat-containing 1-like isoform A n=1 Tax=Micractinium conductrix TaxID=554055 RepID=A0A2P6VPZ6_9CHLO|nr:TPR and ankyrin repeat-containing 1-like isoform A [Micractinium conductrix]|eukprot:PSC76135.1 TPR and ankyrin repeat-containing 1-like isoform A [Micractinium conductrix]